jgi:hypothetical protein
MAGSGVAVGGPAPGNESILTSPNIKNKKQETKKIAAKILIRHQFLRRGAFVIGSHHSAYSLECRNIAIGDVDRLPLPSFLSPSSVFSQAVLGLVRVNIDLGLSILSDQGVPAE